jgi:hypothetical protein
MLSMVKTGSRGLSKKALYRLEQLEREAGLAPVEPVPTSGKSTSDGFQRLEKQRREELRAILADLAKLQQRVERLLGEE